MQTILLNSIAELNNNNSMYALVFIMGFFLTLIVYLFYKWFKIRKEPKYQYVETNDAGFKYWYIEEKHLFYYIPTGKTFTSEWEAIYECNELNNNKIKNK